MCVHQIGRIFRERDLGRRLSVQARMVGIKRHDLESIIQQQTEIYQQICVKKV